MTFTNQFYKLPKKISLAEKNYVNFDLIVHGQGVFIFKNEDTHSSCIFYFYDNKKSNGLKIEFTKYIVNITKLPQNEPLIDENNKIGLIDKPGAYYWVSIDSQNQKIYAGIGEPRRETNIYLFQFPKTGEIKSFLESLVMINIPPESNSLTPLELLRDPITFNIPMLVKNTDELSMMDVAKGAIIPKSNLSPMCQKLYDCVSGKRFILDDDDFPDFSKAIEYSIATTGCWCNTTLIKKSREFSDHPNIKETYLRITLGQNNGESPGIPYVMEIWPIGHYSPVHNHAGASAIIRVLHGSINVSLFPFLCPDKNDIPPFAKKDFNENDITWISPTLNQVHQLKNLETNTKTCITIQCYMYEEENKEHYDYFDFLDDKNQLKHYEPDSDMDFILFKHTMKEEWENRSFCDKIYGCCLIR